MYQRIAPVGREPDEDFSALSAEALKEEAAAAETRRDQDFRYDKKLLTYAAVFWAFAVYMLILGREGSIVAFAALLGYGFFLWFVRRQYPLERRAYLLKQELRSRGTSDAPATTSQTV